MNEIEEIVKLNIGGYKYITTRSTLFKQNTDNFFTVLLSEKFKVIKIDDYFFIDRNGYYFLSNVRFFKN